MSHLSSERLAELADGEPTVAEAEHLAACAICAAERSAHRRLLSMALDERDRIAPPLTEWSTLAAKLREQRIVADDYVAPSTVETGVVPSRSQDRTGVRGSLDSASRQDSCSPWALVR